MTAVPVGPPVDSPLAAQWRRAALGALRKGGRAGPDDTPDDVETRLSHTTYDGLTIAPLYVGPPAVRPSGVRPGAWEVCQRHADPDPAVVAAAIANDLGNDVTALWLTVGDGALGLDRLGEAADPIPLDRVAVTFDAGDQPMVAAAIWLDLARRRGVPGTALRGGFGADPLAEHARTGEPGDSGALAALARRCEVELPGMRAAMVDATVHHDAGASDADELAASLATGVAYLRMMTDAGLGAAAALDRIEFRYAATADQFATIAKLRAARRLWARVAEACGAAGHGRQRQHAVTSAAMMTVRDPWTNILRTTVAAFAAATGGADVITVRPYDSCLGPPGETARRLARNTHALLREEAHLARVADPAAGSWYVESRTEALALRAWERFVEIERAGGMAAAVDSGLLAGWYDETWTARSANIARRADPITGVSEFPDLGERLPVRPAAPVVTRAGGGLPVRWHATVFEELRDRSDAHFRATGARPTVFLVPNGSPAARAARVAFVTNLFAAGGIAVTEADGSADPETIAKLFVDSGLPVACLCGPDADRDAVGPIAAALVSAAATRVWCAGPPGDHPDVHGYLYTGCDVVAALTVTLTDLGVAQ
ncbi:methylmalonyl-CoA mutase subunit beta [Micromonospora sp. NPDC048935]|uniref:methylmalonyl-CoA mutase subunit beta n=1 Tax=Micromonospora sp. NPDC048935 TaxID=3364262 RepID=UPI003712B22E